MASPSVVAVGEVLWDATPSGLFLGGAPCNVAVHLRQLGCTSSVVARLGQDDLGDEAVLRLTERGVDTAHVQRDSAHPTGFVRVTFKDSEPSYVIRPAAWDHLLATEDALEAAKQADALVYGSLAQRETEARAAVQRMATANRHPVFDVNFRAPFVNREVVLTSAQLCWLLKLNEHEAAEVASDWLALAPASASAPQLARALGAHFHCHCVVTCGSKGAALSLLDSGRVVAHSGCRVSAVDAVGAGDAFLATLLEGLLRDADAAPLQLLARANAVGAFVATCPGATPSLDMRAIQTLVDSSPPAWDATLESAL